MHPITYFDKIYIINLPSREHRRREIAEQFQLIGFEINASIVEMFSAVRPSGADGFPSVGAKGCFMSHLGVLKQAKLAGYSNILILEDDVDFSSDFNARINDVVLQLKQKPWNIFYGGYALTEDNELLLPSALLKLVEPTMPIRTSHFIALNRGAIVSAVDYLEAMANRLPGSPDGGPMHVDGAYSWFRREHPDMATFICYPELGHQRPSRTDIHALKWYDKTFGFSQASQFARKIKRYLDR